MRELELVTATKIIQSNDLNYWEKSPLDTLGLFYSRFVSQQVAMTTTSTPITPSLTSWSATTFGRPTTTTSPTTTTDFSSSRKMLTGTFEWTAVKTEWLITPRGASRVSPIFLCYRQTDILNDKTEKTRWSLIRTSIKCGSQVGMLRGIVINSRRIDKIWEIENYAKDRRCQSLTGTPPILFFAAKMRLNLDRRFIWDATETRGSVIGDVF